MEIRQAVESDETAVCALWRQLLDLYEKQVEPGVLQRSFRFAVSHPHQVRIFVAVTEGEGGISGTASLHLGHYSTWNDNWYGHIEDVIVAPSFRRIGVGRALVTHILVVAEAEGLSRLELNALVGNRGARKMYESLGFKTDSLSYERPVKDL